MSTPPLPCQPILPCECGDHAWMRLTAGCVTLVDTDVVDLVAVARWHACGGGSGGRYRYAKARINGKDMRLHRLIVQPAPGLVVDHKNGDGLDNRKRNLREATPHQNSCNVRTHRTPRSGYRGVEAMYNRFRARILHKRQWIALGCFGSAKEAAQAYDHAALRLRGEFAVLNFPRHP